MTTNNTPGNASYKDLVESDKRSILEKVLEASFPTSKYKDDTPASSSEKNGNTPGISDYDVLFGEDIDDIDELWEDIMKRAKEEFKKQEELKQKYPHLDTLNDIFKKPAPKNTRKRGRTKAIDNTLAIMDNFKKRLMEPSEKVPTNKPTTISSNNDYNQPKSSVTSSSNNNYKQLESLIIPSPSKDYHQFKSSIRTIMQGCQPQKTEYPIWKTTENYTPAFSATTNPNFANLRSIKLNPTGTIVKQLCTPVQNKFYTPGHINSWMDAATNSNLIEPPSCKSIRSDVAVHDSDSDDDSMKSIDNTSIYFSPEYQNSAKKNLSVADCKTPPKTRIGSSTQVIKNTMSSNLETLKNTTSSNAQTFKDTILSSPMKSTTVRFRPSPPEYFIYGSDSNSTIASDPIFIEENGNNIQHESPKNYNEFYQDNNENSVPLQNNSPISLQTQYSPCKGNIEYEEHHRIFSSKSLQKNIQKKISDVSTQEPDVFVEDFVRKLNYNIFNSNNKMELKCSMKIKYYK